VNQKLKVLHVLWTPALGGIEKLVHDLAMAQAEDPDLNVAILFGQGKGEFRDQFEKSGIQLHFCEFSSGGDLSPVRILRTIRIMRACDIVHVHSFVLPLCVAIAASKRPVVYTEHGNFGFGRRTGFSDRIKRPLQNIFLKHKVSHLTFNSEFTRSVWEERHDLPKLKRSVVTNGIRLNNGNGTHAALPTGLELALEGAFVVGTSSRFAGFKRIDRLVRAFAQFQKGKNTKLLLVGDGILRKDLEKLVRDLGIEQNTVFTGFRADVRACQALMDVCVFPSEREPFGLVAVETLSLGKPTLVFADGGGIADIVRPLAPEDLVLNEEALEARLCHYYADAGGQEAAERRTGYARCFDIRSVANNFGKIYCGLEAQ
jgi:glycosyltransferase involved in cell wall biosynthesis